LNFTFVPQGGVLYGILFSFHKNILAGDLNCGLAYPDHLVNFENPLDS